MSSLSTSAGLARPPELFRIWPTKKPLKGGVSAPNAWQAVDALELLLAGPELSHLAWMLVNDVLNEGLQRSRV